VELTRHSKNQLIRIVVIGTLLLLFAFVPFELLFGGNKTICIHYQLLGFQCPLCGLTRAVHQFMHLQIASAVHYNVVVLLLPFYFLFDLGTFFFRSPGLRIANKITLYAILIAFLILYAVRIINHVSTV
jgi:hypothetical protein